MHIKIFKLIISKIIGLHCRQNLVRIIVASLGHTLIEFNGIAVAIFKLIWYQFLNKLGCENRSLKREKSLTVPIKSQFDHLLKDLYLITF